MSKERQMIIWARAIRHSNGQADEQILVLESEQAEVIGVSSCGFNRERNSSYDAEVYTLYIHPDHQNQGHQESETLPLFPTRMSCWS